MKKNIIYPRSADKSVVYLKNVIDDPDVTVGDYTMYSDWINDPRQFLKNNVLYHYKINREKLVIGKFCSLACGAKFMFTSGNHAMKSLSTYPFPIFFEEWGLPVGEITSAWDNKGDITVGNDVWLGFDCVVMQGVRIGDGAIIGARSVVTKDIPPYCVAAGSPARIIRKRFDDSTVEKLLSVKWWEWPDEKIKARLKAIRNGDISGLV